MEDQIATDADLPSKGEEMIAVLVTWEYLCVLTSHLYPEDSRISTYSSESMDEINEFEQIIKDMRDEK
jgi:hypothetical protein